MNRALIIVLALCQIIGNTVGSREEDRNVVFAEGSTPLKPAITLQALKKLSEAYSHHDCDGCIKKGQEINDLIAVSEATKDKCTQKFIEHVDELIRNHSKSKLNLIPYLKHYKSHLISECKKQFEITHLDEASDLSEESDDERGDSDTGDSPEEAEELRRLAKEREEEEKWRIQYDKENAIEQEKNDKYTKDWLKRYNSVFFDGVEAKEPGKFQEVLVKLNEDRVIAFGIPDGAMMKKRLEDLLDLRYLSSSSCSNDEFKIFDKLMDEYKQNFNPAILDYVKYHRNSFWETCKRTFFDNLNRGTVKSQVDLFSLVDYAMAADPENGQPHVRISSAAAQKGLAKYIREKLGKKAAKADNVNSLYEGTVKPMCDSLLFKFIGAQELYQIMASHSDLESDFDEKGRRWLAALKVCHSLTTNPSTLKQVQPYLSENDGSKKRSWF